MKGIMFAMVASLVLLSGCVASPNEASPTSSALLSSAQTNQNFTLEINGTTFPLYLSDTPTAEAFKSNLPLTVTMEDLHSNEKFCNLTNTLPTASFAPGQIKAGDLMLYGNDCLVLFYESFSSTYSYTPLGRVENINELKSTLLSNHRVQVTFSKTE